MTALLPARAGGVPMVGAYAVNSVRSSVFVSCFLEWKCL
jgi:hypothetical protein